MNFQAQKEESMEISDEIEEYKKTAVSTQQLARQMNERYPAYVFHEVSWANYMETDHAAAKKKIQKNHVEKNKDAFTLNHVFSNEESAKLIQLTECHGYAMLISAIKGGKGRTNTRMCTDDASLSDIIFERIKHHLPKTYRVHGQTWVLCGLNNVFRFCKYTKNQRFNMHCDKRVDSPEYKREQKASFYTVNIYLNDGRRDYKGGKTMFFNKNYQNGKWKPSSHIVGEPGLALVFNHFPRRYQHSGQALQSGIKYIVRTDVIYQLQQYRRLNDVENGYNGNGKQPRQQQRNQSSYYSSPQSNMMNNYNMRNGTQQRQSVRPPPQSMGIRPTHHFNSQSNMRMNNVRGRRGNGMRGGRGGRGRGRGRGHYDMAFRLNNMGAPNRNRYQKQQQPKEDWPKL